jgi:enamine deaminase RidA (YjgF/YER057c/UK114 family)
VEGAAAREFGGEPVTIHDTLLPPGWPRPKGYANGVAASGRLVVTGGVVGWDAEERFVAADLGGQFRQVLVNTLAILAEAGAGPEHVVRMTWYVTDIEGYKAALPAIGAAYRELMGRNFPAMAVVQVVRLVEAAALIEIETTAVVPEEVRR